MNMFNNNNDNHDDDDEDSTTGRIRRFLRDNREQREEMYRNPLYKEGFKDGKEAGKSEANFKARTAMRGMFEIFDDGDDTPPYI